MAVMRKLPRRPTELGYGMHHLPMGEFDDLKGPPATLELLADGIVERGEETAQTVRSVLFICRDPPRYAVHSLLDCRTAGGRWKAWLDRYGSWKEVVEAHPEFAQGHYHRHRWPRTPEGVPAEVFVAQAQAEDVSSSFP